MEKSRFYHPMGWCMDVIWMLGGSFQGAAENRFVSGSGKSSSVSFARAAGCSAWLRCRNDEELELPRYLGQQRPMEDLSPSSSVVAVAPIGFTISAGRRSAISSCWWKAMASLRQVHLIPSELFETLRQAGYEVGPGDLG
jgi:hypothetical protein